MWGTVETALRWQYSRIALICALIPCILHLWRLSRCNNKNTVPSIVINRFYVFLSDVTFHKECAVFNKWRSTVFQGERVPKNSALT